MAEREPPTPEEFKTWVPAAKLPPLIRKHLGGEVVGTQTVFRRLRTGNLVGAAAETIWPPTPQGDDRKFRRVIVGNEWVALNADSSRAHLWITGETEATVKRQPSRGGDFIISFLDIRFEPSGLATIPGFKEIDWSEYAGDLAPVKSAGAITRIEHKPTIVRRVHSSGTGLITAEPVPPEPPTLVAPERRGAPPKTIFEDALIAVAYQWHLGTWKPERQADVQRALEDWLSEHGADAGSTAVKERARKLWNTFKD